VGMTYVYQGHIEKVPILGRNHAAGRIRSGRDRVRRRRFDRRSYSAPRRLAFAPANARTEVKRCAHHVTTAAGGDGAVREIVEILLQAQGHWDGLLKKYEVE